jgi:hypothetical protein
MTNQGSLVAAQYPVKPTYMNLSPNGVTAGAITAGYSCHQGMMFQSGTDSPSYSALCNMPNAYFGRSKDGLYLPLILSRSAQKWHGEHDLVHFMASNLTLAGNGYSLPSTSVTHQWPFFDHNYVFQNGGSGGPVYGLDSSLTSRMSNDIVAQVSAKNLAVTTSFTCIVRCGYEIQVQPGTALTSQLHICPKSDPLALESYFSIRREMKDGYPADYNDWAKIWGVIKNVARVALPIIGAIGGPVGAGIATAGGGAVGLVDMLTGALSKDKRPTEKGRNPPPQAAKERAQVQDRVRMLVDKAARRGTVTAADVRKKQLAIARARK